MDAAWACPELGENIRNALIARSETNFRSKLAPQLAYGRHRGPTTWNARHAGVLIALYRNRHDQWIIPLTLRPTKLKHHGGQICLPGGRLEQDDHDAREAALREFHEELGVPPKVLLHCGMLERQFVFGSNNLVFPSVATIERPLDRWQPDPVEVAEVIEMPLADLMNPDNRTVQIRSKTVRQHGADRGRLRYRAPGICTANHFVWGATALILDQLARLLHCMHD